MQDLSCNILDVYFPDEELVPSEDKCEYSYSIAKNAEYILSVGSGTLNDMGKSVATRLGIESGILVTAPSMDGYCSKGAALMRGGIKVTDTVNTPSDILIDLDIVCNAPKIMTAAGFGDIVGKYTCLTDWKMANAVKGEEINHKAFKMMEEALDSCVNAYDQLTKYTADAVAKLMNALVVAGLSMAECGNSRPASGSEHHMSHFLEMDFVRRGEKIPMHGIKVAIGCMISIEIYNYIKDNKIQFNGCEKVYKYVEELPKVEDVKAMLLGMGCPTKFSEIGVRKEVMEEMIEKAYTVRDRYTVLTLANELNISKDLKPILMAKYF
jgi:glycerol-1-phosphate dehydrogenase [NAD(P)+]